MKKFVLTLLTINIILCTFAQQSKCGIDTRALINEYASNGAENISFLVKKAPGADLTLFEKAGAIVGQPIGDIVTMRIPVSAIHLLDESKEVLQYSISHKIASPECDKTREDTRADSVQNGLGVIDGMKYDGSGVYIGITDWGFDYTHPNYNGQASSNWRLEKAWDQFKLSGPAPAGFTYGTEISGTARLMAAEGDTSNLYGYNTHGTHVAGIAAGKGKGGVYRGVAPGARLLFCTFELGEAEWIDGVNWMYNTAKKDNKRLVVNSSWGMYSFSTLDGTSLLCQVINSLSDSGVVFVTSAGNNGDNNFHISRDFRNPSDTLKTVVTYYDLVEEAIGQALIIWGNEDNDISASFRMVHGNTVWSSPWFHTNNCNSVIYDTLHCDTIDIAYRVLIERVNPFDNRPHIQIDVEKNPQLELQLFLTATGGTVHAWNVANKTNNAGNEGADFISGGHPGFFGGDPHYGIGEPACAEKCISVAAHSADLWTLDDEHRSIPNSLTSFSSYGPLINGLQKPEISAPGYGVVSSIYFKSNSVYNTPTFSSMVYNEGDRVYRWAPMSGTSMSSPAVTGVVALMLQANPQLSVEQIRDIIHRTARNDALTGPLVERDSADVRWGWGKIDALRAVNEALNRVGIEQAEATQSPLFVFPNPATERLHVATGYGEPATVQLFSIDGRLLKNVQIEQEGDIDVRDMPRGVYIVKVGSRTAKALLR